MVEIRTSICGVMELLSVSAAEEETDLSMAPGRECEGRRVRVFAVEGRDIAGGSALIFPIDIFFKNPHLVDLAPSLLRVGVSSW